MRWPWQKRPAEQSGWLEIVQAYGDVLERTPRGIGGSRPAAALPYDKCIIRAALVEAASQEGVTEEQFGALGVGYVELASFRDGGGRPGVFQETPDPRGMSDSEMREFAQRISEGGDEDVAISVAIAAESKALLNEWLALRERVGNHA